MTTHGQTQTRASTDTRSFDLTDKRRVTLSVIMDGTPGLARRLALALDWRGFVFDRLVIHDRETGHTSERLQIVVTDTRANITALEAMLRRYGPVSEVRTLYKAPVVGARADDAGRSEAASRAERERARVEEAA